MKIKKSRQAKGISLSVNTMILVVLFLIAFGIFVIFILGVGKEEMMSGFSNFMNKVGNIIPILAEKFKPG